MGQTVNLREILNFHLFDLAGTPVTVGSLTTGFVIFVVSLILSFIVRKILARSVTRRGFKDPGTLATLDRLVHYAFIVVGAGTALATVGLDLSALFATGAVFAVALAFALQNILQNFVSGVILLVERSITPMDILLVDEQIVRVERMGIRSTILRSFEDEQIIMPNSNLVQSSVVNLTLGDPYFRVRTSVGVAYATDMEVAREVLRRAAGRVDGRAKDREPVVQFKAFGDSALIFDISVWVDEPWQMPSARSRMNFAIWKALKEAGITVAFPQLDVHLPNTPAPAADGEKAS